MALPSLYQEENFWHAITEALYCLLNWLAGQERRFVAETFIWLAKMLRSVILAADISMIGRVRWESTVLVVVNNNTPYVHDV